MSPSHAATLRDRARSPSFSDSALAVVDASCSLPCLCPPGSRRGVAPTDRPPAPFERAQWATFPFWLNFVRRASCRLRSPFILIAGYRLHFLLARAHPLAALTEEVPREDEVARGGHRQALGQSLDEAEQRGDERGPSERLLSITPTARFPPLDADAIAVREALAPRRNDFTSRSTPRRMCSAAVELPLRW
jgi:hypothetical protein